tara:strand:+ start:58 stop:420 length:363 start_codon:yes stop_codon:yes gene_type:complete
MAVVYQHRRNDTNEIFYIGIGKSKDRASKKSNRNDYWHNIVDKYGYTKEILVSDISWDEAVKEEIRLINKYGRKDLGKGNLVNMTRGGEGCPSNEYSYRQEYTKEELRDFIFKIHPRNNY